MVLVHGGGMTGAMWETTPDGRPGWLHLLLRQGFEVHVVDNVERGRAGWVPNHWPGPVFSRTLQEAWTLFRFGKAEDFDRRRPYPNQQFPVACLEQFARGFVPRWTSTTPAQIDALRAVIEKIGTVTLLCHSQGAQPAFEAAAANPGRVAGIIVIEPSGFPEQPAALATVPIIIAHGDYLEQDATWRGLRDRWRVFQQTIAAAGGRVELIDLAARSPGVSHMPMMDRESEAHLLTIIQGQTRLVNARQGQG